MQYTREEIVIIFSSHNDSHSDDGDGESDNDESESDNDESESDNDNDSEKVHVDTISLLTTSRVRSVFFRRERR